MTITPKQAISEIHRLAADREYPWNAEICMHACRMEAALRMVLSFHSGKRWEPGLANEWRCLQRDAGILPTYIDEAATTKVLCSVIRQVLGEKE